MKTVLAVVGVLAILIVVVIGGGGYYMYKKSSSAMAQAGERQIYKFIATKHPAESVAESLHRIVNGCKLHPSWKSTYLMSVAMVAIGNGIVTDEKVRMLDEAAQMAEKDAISREQFTAFMQKYQSVLSKQNYTQNSYTQTR